MTQSNTPATIAQTISTTTLPALIQQLRRSAIGGDLFCNQISSYAENINYPPYNLETTGDDGYRLTLAVAGFSKDEINVRIEEGALIVEGKKEIRSDDESFLHRGISQRDFTRTFKLMEHIIVLKASMADGLLIVDLQRELPEALKPRIIDIA
jgi:molecular chaperone IbpA